MKRPETRYARSGDVMIAYQVMGEGNPVDLVLAPGTMSHLELSWEYADIAWLNERLSSFSRLVRFDKRGTGMSDRPTDAATLEERTDDIRAVMDAIGSERAYLLGYSEGGNMACLFAATYPERTRGILLWGVQARWVSTADYPWGLSADQQRTMIDDLAEHGVTDEYLFGPGAGMPAEGYPLEEMELDRRLARAAASPAAYAALERMNLEIDTRGFLAGIHVPTLVMNRTHDPVANVEAARDLAAHIPGARFVEFPGDVHWVARTAPDAEEIVATIQEFVTGDRPVTAPDRVLATVLFTDIVGSTRLAADLGDARGSWYSRSTTPVPARRSSAIWAASLIPPGTGCWRRSMARLERSAARRRSVRRSSRWASRSGPARTPARSSASMTASRGSPSTSAPGSPRSPDLQRSGSARRSRT